MSSEYQQNFTDEQNNSCESDYEFVNHSSSRENSDGEVEGYKKIRNSSETVVNRRLSKNFDFNQSEKLRLCLSPEKITLLTNSPRRCSPRELYIESQEQKEDKKRSVPSFTIVPIKVGLGKEVCGKLDESKVNLPEIVLTSFEVAAASKKAATSTSSGFLGKTAKNVIETKATIHSENVSGNISKAFPVSDALPSANVYQHDDQSPSPESYLDTQLSAASSLSNQSTDISSDMTNFCEKPMNLAPNAMAQQKQSIDNIDCIESSSLASVTVKALPVPAELKCGICHEALKDPRTLHCLHSFCFQCLVDENFKQDSSIPFWSQPNQKDYDWKSSNKSSSSLKSISVESSPEMSYRNSSTGSARPESRSSFASFRRKKSIDKLIAKNKPSKHVELQPQSNERSRIILCKECQQPTEVPIGGIRQLPQNLVISRKIDAIKLKIGNDVISKVWCSLCYVGSNATFHCVTCTINLCTFCKEAHERQRNTANHQIKNIIELRNNRNAKTLLKKESLKCCMHPGFEMKSFCTTCLQVACSDCLALLHKGHKHESITKSFGVYQKYIKESTDQARPLCDYAHHSISRLNEIAKRINKKCDNTQAEVESFMTAYKEAIELHGRTLIQQINRARESKIQMIVEQQLDMEKRSAEVLNAITFSENLTESGTEVEILSFVNIILKRFEFCQKFKPPIDPKISDTLHFLPEVRAPASKNQRNIPIFGIITTQVVEPILCTLETEGYTQLRVHRKVEMVILSRDADGMPLCHGGLKPNALVKYKESSSKYLPIEVNDRRDGSYGINFVPDAPGTIILTITINDKHIKGSPFTFAARTVRPHNGIYHCCAFCSSKGSKQASCSCDGRMPGFNGCGHGHSGHPGRRHWSCCGNVLENSECTAANRLLNP